MCTGDPWISNFQLSFILFLFLILLNDLGPFGQPYPFGSRQTLRPFGVQSWQGGVLYVGKAIWVLENYTGKTNTVLLSESHQ